MIQVKLVSHTPNPEVVVAAAARTCMRNMDYEAICADIKEADIERIVTTVILRNHLSVLEHASFTFAITGVSRVLTHQLVRHRIASHSQLSQQRTDSSQINFTVPPDIQKHPVLANEYQNTMKRCQDLYKRLVQEGISKSSARYILPSGFNTRILTTMNARSLFNLLAQRECEVEDWEFRQVAQLIHNEVMTVAPHIFRFAGPPCETQGYCTEGKKGQECSRYGQVAVIKVSRHRDTKAQPVHV